LIGPVGATGAAGTPGATGPQGPQGIPGPAGSVAAAFANKFRNATFDIGQRSTGGTVAAAATTYTLDGWQLSPTGASCSWAQQKNANIVGSSLRLNANPGMTGIFLRQRIESFNAAQLLANNKTAIPVTVQFLVVNKTGALIQPTISTSWPTSPDAFGTMTADLAVTNLQSIPDNTAAVVAYTFTPNVNCINGYQVSLGFGGGLNTTASGHYIDVGQADIRPAPGVALGLTASPPLPELRPIAVELSSCLRHFFASPPGFVFIYVGAAGGVGTYAIASATAFFPVPMRVAPALLSGSFTISNCSSPALAFLNNMFVTYSSNTTGSPNNFGSCTLSAGLWSAEL
jgi:hypothetical protein